MRRSTLAMYYDNESYYYEHLENMAGLKRLYDYQDKHELIMPLTRDDFTPFACRR